MSPVCESDMLDGSTGNVNMTASSFQLNKEPEKALHSVDYPEQYWSPHEFDNQTPYVIVEIRSVDVPRILKINFWVQNVGTVAVDFEDDTSYVSLLQS